jgi:ornithine carbamoyltransferase
MGSPRHFLDLSELSTETLRGILDDSHRIKGERAAGAGEARPLEGRVLAMIFDRPVDPDRVFRSDVAYAASSAARPSC